MNITKELFDKFETPSIEIITKLKELCKEVNGDENNYAERGELDFELNDKSYSLVEVEEEDISDEGKYQYGGTTYQLVEFDKTICEYPNENSTIKEFNLFVYVSYSRSGSYFTDWYYSYEEPQIQTIEVKHVERQVIEEHDVFNFVGEDDKTIEDSDDVDDGDWD